MSPAAPPRSHTHKIKKKGGEKKKISVAGCCMTHSISSLHNVPRAEKKAWYIAQLVWRKIGKTEEKKK